VGGFFPLHPPRGGLVATPQTHMCTKNIHYYSCKEYNTYPTPKCQELENMALREMHNVPYVGYLRYRKTIAVVKSQFFWLVMKKEVADYISRCLEFQKVKAEHRHPARFLQPFHILEWKQEVVTIEFITKLPRIVKQHDSIMVVVDKLTKAAHFILVNIIQKENNIA
jgi:hypothetical protein